MHRSIKSGTDPSVQRRALSRAATETGPERVRARRRSDHPGVAPPGAAKSTGTPPKLKPQGIQPRQLPLFFAPRDAELPAITTAPPTERAPSRIAWASLLARVSSIDVTVGSRCEGPIRVVRTVTDPDEIATALEPQHVPDSGSDHPRRRAPAAPRGDDSGAYRPSQWKHDHASCEPLHAQ